MNSLLAGLGVETFWEKFELAGITMVVLGVAGEFLLIFKKFPFNPTSFGHLELFLGRSKKFWEKCFSGLVAIGVSVEMVTFPMVLKESHTEIAVLKNKTEGLKYQAEVLKNKTEELRQKNNDLEAQVDAEIKDRIDVEMALFPRVFEYDTKLAQYAGTEFSISVETSDKPMDGRFDDEKKEAMDFGNQLREVLLNSRWVPLDAKGGGNDGVIVVVSPGISMKGSPFDSTPESRRALAAATELVKALRNSRILTVLRVFANGPPSNAVRIFIGNKPDLDEIKNESSRFGNEGM